MIRAHMYEEQIAPPNWADLQNSDNTEKIGMYEALSCLENSQAFSW